ncbi:MULTISPECIES: sensor domain-containing diguanylate cyclase [Bacillus]|uniref:sensor domain-containing diguanylate cyclase n=1 Tax=Bacillus TaxID=1386 RepID=UPI000BB817F2|nr:MULTISPECIES: sensor domain-containing diguanylate cyclase [Bacillus]
MDEKLNYAPCGYLTLSDNGTILCINQTLLTILNYDIEEVQEEHVNLILTKPSRIIFQIYFFPRMKVEEKVEEMHITLKLKNGQNLPVLLNGVRIKRDGLIINDCILFPMKQRYEHEKVILAAKKDAEESEKKKVQAISELEKVKIELEYKQKELLELNRKLQRLAVTDELTGLFNRRSYKEALYKNLSLFKETSILFSLLLIDIDYFKRINDNFGHLVGDQILQKFANLLKHELREDDFAARYGGEEFTLILPNTNINESIIVAERIRKSIETAEWTIPSVTVSIGVATTRKGDTKKSIQSRADAALYASKHKGRNKITHASQMV